MTALRLNEFQGYSRILQDPGKRPGGVNLVVRRSKNKDFVSDGLREQLVTNVGACELQMLKS